MIHVRCRPATFAALQLQVAYLSAGRFEANGGLPRERTKLSLQTMSRDVDIPPSAPNPLRFPNSSSDKLIKCARASKSGSRSRCLCQEASSKALQSTLCRKELHQLPGLEETRQPKAHREVVTVSLLVVVRRDVVIRVGSSVVDADLGVVGTRLMVSPGSGIPCRSGERRSQSRCMWWTGRRGATGRRRIDGFGSGGSGRPTTSRRARSRGPMKRDGQIDESLSGWKEPILQRGSRRACTRGG